MSQPLSKKSSRKGGGKTDSAKSKQGAGMSTRASEGKSKSSEPGKVEGAKPISSMSKPSVKPGSAATQKSTDSCKSKTKSGSSVLPGAKGGVKQQHPQTTATSQSKMGQLFGKTSNLDTKENQDGTHPEKLTGTSLHKNNDSKIQDEDPFDLLAGTLPSEEPDKSTPEYTGPKVKESDVTKEKGKRVGERDDTIPPDYRFKERPDPKNKDKPASSSTGPGAKLKTTEKTMTKDDVLDSLAADFGEISADPLSKCSAATSHSAPPPFTVKQAPLQASTAATVSTSQTGAKDEDPFDLLAATLPSEAPDKSGPTYTGPPVKESDVTKQRIDRMGERDDTLPPDYRFKEQPAPKDKGPLASSTDSGAKPKIMTEGDVLESLSADLVQSSPAPSSKCSAAIPHFAEPPSLTQQPPLQASKAASVSTNQTGKKAPDKDSLSKAPLQASKPATVSASQPGPKGKDPFDLLAATLPSEAPDDSAPKYTGPEVKESDATKKKGVRVGEWESTIPPDYRFKEQPGPKDKLAPSPTGPGTAAKPKTMTEDDVMDYMSADIIQSSPAPISKCSAATIHAAAPLSMQIEAPCQASKTADVSAGQTGAKLSEKDKDKLAPSFTDPGEKPKVMTDDDILDSLSGDLVQSSVAPISKCSVATPQIAALPSKQKEVMTDDDILGSQSGDFVQSPVALISKCSVPTPQFAAFPSMQKKAPLEASTAGSVSASQTHAKDKDPFDLLAETLPSEAPDNSAPKYSGPEVKEPDAKEKSIERMGERESTIPPEYRYGKQPDSKDKGKPTSPATSPGAKPKTMTEDDVLTSLSADLVQSSAAQVSKCSAPVSHVAAPHSKQKQEPLKASTAASVSANQSAPMGKDPFDLLAATLPSEAPDKSAPKYTGPAVKESDSSKKKAELVGETEGSIPPEYRFTAPADPKDKGTSKMPSSTGPGTKPKAMTEGDALKALSTGFVESSVAPVSKCSVPVSHTVAPPSLQKPAMTEGDALKALSAGFVESSVAPVSKCSVPVSHTVAPPSLQKPAPLQASTAASVSSSQSSTKDKDPFDLLASTLPSEAPDKSGPTYTGPPVKESDANKKKAERVGEIEESIPPDYRFTAQTDPKDKGKPASSFAAAGAKPKLMTKEELVDSLSSDFDSSSSASHSVAPVSKQKESKEKPAANPDTKKARKC